MKITRRDAIVDISDVVNLALLSGFICTPMAVLAGQQKKRRIFRGTFASTRTDITKEYFSDETIREIQKQLSELPVQYKGNKNENIGRVIDSRLIRGPETDGLLTIEIDIELVDEEAISRVLKNGGYAVFGGQGELHAGKNGIKEIKKAVAQYVLLTNGPCDKGLVPLIEIGA